MTPVSEVLEAAADRIVVFTNPERGALARIEVPSGRRGKDAERLGAWEYLPVAIHAPTAEAATQKAADFLASERARIAAQSETKERRKAALAKARQASRQPNTGEASNVR